MFETETSKRTEAANHFLRKQDLERNQLLQLLQQLNQPDNVVQDDDFILRESQMIPSISEKYHHIKLPDLNF